MTSKKPIYYDKNDLPDDELFAEDEDNLQIPIVEKNAFILNVERKSCLKTKSPQKKPTGRLFEQTRELFCFYCDET